ncbi:MAG: SHOCT domain-containing protein [Halobacteria archaeon]|nr:SHOCT domain-containing protein [Halobacteria archaeon]
MKLKTRITKTLGVTAGSVVLATGTALAHAGDDYGAHHGMWGDGMWGFGTPLMWVWMLFWALILIALPLAVLYLIMKQSSKSENDRDRALEILREQYARGEISDDEFEKRHSRLK